MIEDPCDWQLSEDSLLYRSDTLIAVNKPSGVLVHNSHYAGSKERSLRQELGRICGRRVFPVHRIDRGAGGVVLFASEREHAARWQTALSSPATTKTYVAIVRGHPKTAMMINRDIKIDGVAKAAHTHMRPICSSLVERMSLIALQLATGRKHQARRHCKHISHPIVGDSTWGRGEINRHARARWGLSRLALHLAAVELSIDADTRLLIRAPIPDDLAEPIRSLFGYAGDPTAVFDQAPAAAG